MGPRGRVAVGVVAVALLGAGVGAKAYRDHVQAQNQELAWLVEQSNTWDAVVDDCLRRSPGVMSMSPAQCRETLGADLDTMRARGFDPGQIDRMRAKLGRAADVAEVRWIAVEAPAAAAIDAAGRRALASDRAGAQHALDAIGRGALLVETLAPESDHEIHRTVGMIAARDRADLAAWKRIALPDRRGTAGANDDWYLLRGSSLCLLGERARGQAALAEGERQRSSSASPSPHLDLAWRACGDGSPTPSSPVARGKDTSDTAWARTVMVVAELGGEPKRAPGRSAREHLEARLVAALPAGAPVPAWKEPWPLTVAAHALATGASREEIVEAARSRGPRRPYPCHGDPKPDEPVEPADPRGLRVDGAIDPSDPEDLLYTSTHSGYGPPAIPRAAEVLEAAAGEVARAAEALPPCEGASAACPRASVERLAEDLAILAARARLARGEPELAKKAARGAPLLLAAGVSLAAGDPSGARELAERAVAAKPSRRAAVDVHLVLARALAELGQWAPALAEARAAEVAFGACWPAGKAEQLPRELRVRVLWQLAAIAVHLGEPPPPDLARYEPGDASAALPPSASEARVVDAWRAALGGDSARRDARMRWIHGVSGEASGPELYVLSRLAGPHEAEVWLDVVEASRVGDAVAQVRRGGRLRAMRRGTAARWSGDAAAAAAWAERQRLLSELARGPRAELLAYYVGL